MMSDGVEEREEREREDQNRRRSARLKNIYGNREAVFRREILGIADGTNEPASRPGENGTIINDEPCPRSPHTPPPIAQPTPPSPIDQRISGTAMLLLIYALVGMLVAGFFVVVSPLAGKIHVPPSFQAWNLTADMIVAWLFVSTSAGIIFGMKRDHIKQ